MTCEEGEGGEGRETEVRAQCVGRSSWGAELTGGVRSESQGGGEAQGRSKAWSGTHTVQRWARSGAVWLTVQMAQTHWQGGGGGQGVARCGVRECERERAGGGQGRARSEGLESANQRCAATTRTKAGAPGMRGRVGMSEQ